MTDPDLAHLQAVARGLPPFERVGVFSPLREGEWRVFPGATGLPRLRWDLDRPAWRQFDLLVACNVFMYAEAPERWFRHVLASCRYFLLLDLVRRRRDAHGEFGNDGDRMRYAVGGAEPRAEVGERQTDLEALLGDRLLGHRLFHGGANPQDDDPLHLLALIRGDLSGPILRVDDYPTGIRPILPDLGPLHAILERLEARALPYHLGIVPALLTDEMSAFLRGLRHMIPVVHGHDHAYPRYAPLLEAAGDPFNVGTVGTFNEFAGQPYGVVLGRLLDARRRLEDRLGRHVDTYIPPCNRGDRTTGRALEEAGFVRYLSEKRIPGCRLPGIPSGFYGRSNDYDYSRRPDVVTLHLTWEWDLQRGGDHESLDRLLDHLAARRSEEEALATRLGTMVGGLEPAAV